MNREEIEAAALWDMLITFTARIEVYGPKVLELLKQHIESRSDNRAYEALYMQFVNQIVYLSEDSDAPTNS